SLFTSGSTIWGDWAFTERARLWEKSATARTKTRPFDLISFSSLVEPFGSLNVSRDGGGRGGEWAKGGGGMKGRMGEWPKGRRGEGGRGEEGRRVSLSPIRPFASSSPYCNY